MAFDWGVGFFLIDAHVAAAGPVVDELCVGEGWIDAEGVVVPADAEWVVIYHLAGGDVEDDAEFCAGDIAAVAEAGDDGVEGEGEAECADGGHGGEHAEAAPGGFFEETDESDDDGAAGEHDEGGAGEGALDEDGAGDEACGGPDVIEVEVVAFGVAAVLFDGGEGEGPIACGEETVDGHEAHEAEETALSDWAVFDGDAEGWPESEEEGQDDGQLDPVGGGHGAWRAFGT